MRQTTVEAKKALVNDIRKLHEKIVDKDKMPTMTMNSSFKTAEPTPFGERSVKLMSARQVRFQYHKM
jgi:hypothetical protein